jgi:hypothetical protein
MFLTRDELKDMTEATKRPLQEEWLKRQRIPYTKGRKGGLNVLRAYVERAHGLKTEVKEDMELDMAAFQRMHQKG